MSQAHLGCFCGTVTPNVNMLDIFKQNERADNPNSILNFGQMSLRKLSMICPEGTKVKINGKEIPLITGIFELGMDQINICKARFTLTETGAIKINGSRDGVKRARRKLKMFHREYLAGRKTLFEIDQYMECQTAYYRNFDDHGRLLRLRRLHYAMFSRYREQEQLKKSA